MDKRRARITYLLIAGTLCLLAWAASAMPQLKKQQLPSNDPPPENTRQKPQVVTIPNKRPQVEVVFALDTTGSMGGLIDGAKRKIWSIAQFIQSGQPKPDVRIGLVAYRDIGDEYVTRFYDLSDDVDQVFERLASFQANGGGDGPEHVSKALHDAVYRSSWTQDQSTLKLVYLVGDAPPHTDYKDGFDYHAIARHAHDRGIHINTIRCGADEQTRSVWNEISRAAAGEYASIDQSGGVRTVATPFDDKMAELNRRLASTTIGYGASGSAMRSKVAASTALPAAMQADRAAYFAAKGEGAVGGSGDLVNDVMRGHVAAEAVPIAALPAEMQTMKPEARKALIEEKSRERNEVAKEISVLAKQRKDYLHSAAAAPGKDARPSFDSEVESTLRKQAHSVGLGL
jgi:Mg-chelatase subunit ChlD